MLGPSSSSPGAPPVSADDVVDIVDAGFREARRIRAGIRLPNPARTAMMLAVSDTTNALLGVFRMQDATVFSIDVAVAKSRNVTYFSSADIDPLDTMDCPGPADPPNTLGDCRGQAFRAGTAITNRTLSFGAQPFFPSGIEGSWPASGSRSRRVRSGRRSSSIPTIRAPTGSSRPTAGRTASCSSPARRRSTPAACWPGGYGVSGDGVEQDDIVTVSGGARRHRRARLPARPANPRRSVFVRGVRLPFVKFNRRPRAVAEAA